jgi:RNA recognition motif-containing protein
MEICVSNLSKATTEAQIIDLFAPFGIVHCSRVRTVSDVSKNNMKTFAYILIPDQQRAAEAIAALNNSMLAGSAINVKQAG